MKFLWQSNAPWSGTGYGQQTRLVLKALKERGHEPTCFAFYGLAGGAVEYDGYTVLPNSNYEVWGNDVIKAHAFRSGAEVICSLIDIFVLEMAQWATLEVPWVGWVPLDSETMGLQTLERLKIIDHPIAMSAFGANQMIEAGVEPAMVIPHAVDPVFTRLEPEENEWRKAIGLDDDVFLIGMVMANKGHRKQFPAQLHAVKIFKDQHPDVNVKVYIHTEATSVMGGWDIKQVVDKLGLRGHVFVTNQYDAAVVAAGPELLAQMYNSFDVLMNVSAGEGFGIPIIEAQACGTPVITGDWTSMPEITHYGYTVEAESKFLAPHYGYHFIPSIEDMAYRLECVYRMSNKAASVEAAAWAQENFSVDVVGGMWDAVLQLVGAGAKRPEPHIRRPQPILTTDIAVARAAMDAERHEYGTLNDRAPEYIAVHEEMLKYGLKDGDRILDLGAADCDLDHFLRAQGWRGVYSPVDMIIDGTDLNDYEVPHGYDFIVVEQVIEHLPNWSDFLDECEATGSVVVVATPNGEVVPDHDKHDMAHQMAHVAWLTENDFVSRGYDVTLREFTGNGLGDTIIASKWNGVKTNGANLDRTAETVSG